MGPGTRGDLSEIRKPRRLLFSGAALLGLFASCGDSTTKPTPTSDTWFGFAVQCGNCPGLTNVDIDRSTVPYRARLRVGQQTSLRAASRSSCEASAVPLDVVRWIVGSPPVLRVDPTSSESAVVTALSTGSSTLVLERRSPDGTLSQKSLKDAANTTGCGELPDLVFEIVP